MYRLHLASAVLNPLQVDVAEAGARHPLQAVHVVLVDLHAEHLRVALDVVPLGVGLQRLLDGGILQPGGQFGGVDQVVDDALRGDRETNRDSRREKDCMLQLLSTSGATVGELPFVITINE